MTDPAITRLRESMGGEDTILAALDSLALIEITGEDAQDFLHGQFSNDVAAIGQHHGLCRQRQLNAYCNPKGRVLAVIHLLRAEDHAAGFHLLVPAELADELVSRLRMFVLRARVGIEVRADVALLGLIGEVGDADTGGLAWAAVDGIVPRRILFGEKAAAEVFMRESGIAAGVGSDLWRLADILSGIPQIYPATTGAFIPQSINLDYVDGVSFTKGCYPGQEIVARLRHRGKAKQRMLAGVVRGLEALVPGDPLFSPQRPGQKAGQVVDAVRTGDGEFTFSATAPVAEPESKSESPLLVGAETGPALTPIPLPYAVSP